jgi:DNA polymerase
VELLDELRQRYEREAPHSRFVTDHHSIVFGEGDPCARLMFVGEAPGAEEDRTGRPFVGRAGQLLDRMIHAMGLSREDVYIANVLKTRPPNNATPTTDECAACAPYLFEQIMIIRPEVIVSLGLPASRTLLTSAAPPGHRPGRAGAVAGLVGPRHAHLPPGVPAQVVHDREPAEGLGRSAAGYGPTRAAHAHQRGRFRGHPRIRCLRQSPKISQLSRQHWKFADKLATI